MNIELLLVDKMHNKDNLFEKFILDFKNNKKIIPLMVKNNIIGEIKDLFIKQENLWAIIQLGNISVEFIEEPLTITEVVLLQNTKINIQKEL